MKNITVLVLDFSNMYVSYMAIRSNVHSKMTLVSVLKDHVTLLNLLIFVTLSLFFLICRRTIVKIGDTTN